MRIEQTLGSAVPDAVLAEAETIRDIARALVPIRGTAAAAVVPLVRSRRRTRSGSSTDRSGNAYRSARMAGSRATGPHRTFFLSMTRRNPVAHRLFPALRRAATGARHGSPVSRGVRAGEPVALMLPTGREFFEGYIRHFVRAGHSSASLSTCASEPDRKSSAPARLNNCELRSAGAADIRAARGESRICCAQLENAPRQPIATVDELSTTRRTARPTPAVAAHEITRSCNSRPGAPPSRKASSSLTRTCSRTCRHAAATGPRRGRLRVLAAALSRHGTDRRVFCSLLPASARADVAAARSWRVRRAGCGRIIAIGHDLGRAQLRLRALSHPITSRAGGPRPLLAAHGVQRRRAVSPTPALLRRFARYGLDPRRWCRCMALRRARLASPFLRWARPAFDRIDRERLSPSGTAASADAPFHALESSACGARSPAMRCGSPTHVGWSSRAPPRAGRVPKDLPRRAAIIRDPATPTVPRYGWLNTGDLGYLADGEFTCAAVQGHHHPRRPNFTRTSSRKP